MVIRISNFNLTEHFYITTMRITLSLAPPRTKTPVFITATYTHTDLRSKSRGNCCLPEFIVPSICHSYKEAGAACLAARPDHAWYRVPTTATFTLLCPVCCRRFYDARNARVSQERIFCCLYRYAACGMLSFKVGYVRLFSVGYVQVF